MHDRLSPSPALVVALEQAVRRAGTCRMAMRRARDQGRAAGGRLRAAMTTRMAKRDLVGSPRRNRSCSILAAGDHRAVRCDDRRPTCRANVRGRDRKLGFAIERYGKRIRASLLLDLRLRRRVPCKRKGYDLLVQEEAGLPRSRSAGAERVASRSPHRGGPQCYEAISPLLARGAQRRGATSGFRCRRAGE